eukprot:1456987-Rhodomonas_salina.1
MVGVCRGAGALQSSRPNSTTRQVLPNQTQNTRGPSTNRTEIGGSSSLISPSSRTPAHTGSAAFDVGFCTPLKMRDLREGLWVPGGDGGGVWRRELRAQAQDHPTLRELPV